MSLNYISLFSGGGGFSVGFNAIGFKCILANDIDSDAEATHKHNFPDTPFLRKDIAQLRVAEILKATNNIKPDVLIGGPPCQGFSVMGDKYGADPRNHLFKHYVNLVRALTPKCFVFENVKGLIQLQKGEFFKNLCIDFANCGYNIYYSLLDASDYGVPQKRERVIIFGTKVQKKFIFPLASKKSIKELKVFENVGEAINDLIYKGEDIDNHISLNHKEIVVERYKLIKEGGKLPKPELLPEKIRRKNFGSTYQRLHRKKLAVTLVPGNNAFPVHPILNRSLTPREAARIQSFPDNHKFIGNRRKQCILIGNAVPPLLAANIGKNIKVHLLKESSLPDHSKIFICKPKKINIKKNISNINSKNKYTCIDLFAGAGGITSGLVNSGFTPLLSCDFDKHVKNTHELNFHSIPYVHGDLSDKNIFKSIKSSLQKKEITLLAGGPPCQGFSIFGKRRFINTKNYNPSTDPRNKLVFTYIEYVKYFRPKWILMENVAGFANLDNGFFLKEIIKLLDKIGYKDCQWKIINTADYGIPQKRKRFILIANRTGNIIPWPKPKYFEKPKSWQLPYRTVGEVITDLAEEKSYSHFKNHESMKHSKMITERYSFVEEGKKMDVEKLPKHLQYAKMTGQKIKNFSHVYRRLHRDEPSITLVPGHNAFPIHPWLNRLLTVREAARIQTFSDDIEFCGPSKDQCIQVGNAFPPMMAERLGQSIIKAIENNWNKGNVSKLANYSILDKSEYEEEEKQLQLNL